MTGALASIVVNNYNYARFLRTAIESALAQDYQPLEIIVVDDGSTDGSRAVIESFGDRVQPIFKQNGGQGSAFNAGFAAARGDVVLFLDSDDALLPDAVTRAMARFDKANVVKVYGQLWEVDATGERMGALIPKFDLLEGDLRARVHESGPGAIPESPTTGNAWSRAFLERVLPMPEDEFRINSDCYLSTLAPAYGELRVLPEPMGLYRVHGDNNYLSLSVGEKSRRHLEMYLVRCRLLAHHFEQLGQPASASKWQSETFHLDYLQRICETSAELADIIPPGGRFVLVDDGQWGDGRAGTAALLGRSAIPFLERDGLYHGRPADSAHAISEFERVRVEHGAQYAVVIWTAYWWLDYYSDFATHLRSHYRCLLNNERAVVMELPA